MTLSCGIHSDGARRLVRQMIFAPGCAAWTPVSLIRGGRCGMPASIEVEHLAAERGRERYATMIDDTPRPGLHCVCRG